MTAPRFDIIAIGNAIVDVMAPASDELVERLAMTRGGMTLIDTPRAHELYAAMGPAREISGGSAANTLACMAQLGAACAFIGQVADDQLGEVFAHDVRAAGIVFEIDRVGTDLLLARIVDGADISDAAVPYMAAVELTALGGVPARLYRISFSGELAYEIGVPSGYGEALAAALMAAGSDLGVTPYGLEAMSVMRIEKGHVAGAELNGQTTAADLGLGKMVSTKKDFIGRTMAQRPALTDPDRPTLVGFRTVNAADRVTSGAHFLDTGAAPTMANDLGHITSVAFSPAEGRWIGLGLMVRGPQRIGERVRAWDGVRNRDVPIELCAPCFYDPAGARLRG